MTCPMMALQCLSLTEHVKDSQQKVRRGFRPGMRNFNADQTVVARKARSHYVLRAAPTSALRTVCGESRTTASVPLPKFFSRQSFQRYFASLCLFCNHVLQKTAHGTNMSFDGMLPPISHLECVMRKYITDSQELAVSPRRQGLFAMAAVASFFMRFLA